MKEHETQRICEVKLFDNTLYDLDDARYIRGDIEQEDETVRVALLPKLSDAQRVIHEKWPVAAEPSRGW